MAHNTDDDRLLGAIEAGGTKFRAATIEANGDVRAQVHIETTTPDVTLGAVGAFFEAQPPVAALGIASFGPLILDPQAPGYGSMGPTPKPGWTGVDLLGRLGAVTAGPCAIQTDVEAAVVAEHQLGAGQGYDSIAYVTVGTGIGVGVLIDGEVFRGRDHLELGHIPIRRSPDDDFGGICPFHGDCLEGMASGPAIEARWHDRPSALGERDDVWDLEADYLAQLVRVITYAFSCDKVLFSGGVAARSHLAPRIAAATKRQLAGYSISHADNSDLVATAALGNDAGLIGAGLLAATL